MSLTGLEAVAEEVAADAPVVEGRSQWQLTWRRLRADKVAMASLIVIGVIVVLAIAAPVRRDHPPPAEHRLPEQRRDRGGQPGAPGHRRVLAGHRRHRP